MLVNNCHFICTLLCECIMLFQKLYDLSRHNCRWWAHCNLWDLWGKKISTKQMINHCEKGKANISVWLVEQELLTLPEHRSSPPVFSVTRSLILYVCFVDRCLFFCTFSFGHCAVCSSSIYGFWLPLWYLQTLLLLRFIGGN